MEDNESSSPNSSSSTSNSSSVLSSNTRKSNSGSSTGSSAYFPPSASNFTLGVNLDSGNKKTPSQHHTSRSSSPNYTLGVDLGLDKKANHTPYVSQSFAPKKPLGVNPENPKSSQLSPNDPKQQQTSSLKQPSTLLQDPKRQQSKNEKDISPQTNNPKKESSSSISPESDYESYHKKAGMQIVFEVDENGSGSLRVEIPQLGKFSNFPVLIIEGATSGRSGSMNNPKYQFIEKSGPIPEGQFILDKRTLTERNFVEAVWRVKVRGQGDWGSFDVPLNPLSGTKIGNRNNFYLHGGSKPGSAGCVDVGGGLSGNAKTHDLVSYIKNSPSNHIPFVVRYKNK